MLGEKDFMLDAIKSYEDVDSWKTVMFLYNSALKEVGTKLEILNDEFQHVHQYNPIEHIKTRIKTPESIVKKLKRYGHEAVSYTHLNCKDRGQSYKQRGERR